MITYLDLVFPGRFNSRADVFATIESSEKIIKVAKETHQPIIRLHNTNGSTTVVFTERAEAILEKAKIKYYKN